MKTFLPRTLRVRFLVGAAAAFAAAVPAAWAFPIIQANGLMWAAIAYSRAWDISAGGRWWMTEKPSKNSCVNFPGAIAPYAQADTAAS